MGIELTGRLLNNLTHIKFVFTTLFNTHVKEEKGMREVFKVIIGLEI